MIESIFAFSQNMRQAAGICGILWLVVPLLPLQAAEKSWKRHTIDGSSRGADGVRLADANGDSRLDLVTGWEEGGVVRLALQPPAESLREPWPAVTVGKAPSVEDAVLVDLDGDGHVDVVSASEGSERAIRFHWAPLDRGRLLESGAWQTRKLPASLDVMAWMFCVPADIDGRHGVDLFAGGKSRGAAVGWFEAPADARRLDEWKWHPIRPAGWIMSLVAEDLDGDGDPDLVLSDRKGSRRGCFWLQHPGVASLSASPWKEHLMGGKDREVMFLSLTDMDGDALLDALVATKPRKILWLTRKRLNEFDNRSSWTELAIEFGGTVGTAKAVAAGDLDLDGKLDLVVTCEGANKEKSGIFWLSRVGSTPTAEWKQHPLGGAAGVKYDLVELQDLDGDGDLDALTCEERDNLGVVWYENPSR